ncbi:hypothetical protein LCGC14_1688250 [marine sediment metagenome]|uniref:Uncharacterized protein n=1 Tax=marine sediment metagenome TaxID=412755 RepID=A0A0F9I944_9ZZZZ
MAKCKSFGCKQESHPDPESCGFCGDCWRGREEHTEYEKRWYGYWNLRGKNHTPVWIRCPSCNALTRVKDKDNYNAECARCDHFWGWKMTLICKSSK